MDEIAISVENLKKNFRIPKSDNSGITSLFKSVLGIEGYSVKEVINGISFDVKKGECFGILGPNGTGKSTLLKLLAGVLYPDNGTIDITGEVFPLLNLGVGFQNDLTARDNVYQYGSLLGLSDSQLNDKMDDIFRYAELEGYENLQVKHFSSGMRVRLAFSIAMQVEPDIVLMDEVLSVGDISFKSKSKEKILEICSSGKTVVIVSHSTATITDICDRAMFLKAGKIGMIGDPEDVVDAYLDAMAEFLGPGEIYSAQKRRNHQIKSGKEKSHSRIVTEIITGNNITDLIAETYDEQTGKLLNQYLYSKRLKRKSHLEESLNYNKEITEGTACLWATQVRDLGDELQSRTIARKLLEKVWDYGIISIGNEEFSNFFSCDWTNHFSFIPKNYSTAILIDDSDIIPVIFDSRERIKADSRTVNKILKNSGQLSCDDKLIVFPAEMANRGSIKSLLNDEKIQFIIQVPVKDLEDNESCIQFLDSLVSGDNFDIYEEKSIFSRKGRFQLYDHETEGFGYYHPTIASKDYERFYRDIQILQDLFSTNQKENPLQPDVFIREVARKNARYFTGTKQGNLIKVSPDDNAIKIRNRCMGKILLLVHGPEDPVRCYRQNNIRRLSELWFKQYSDIFLKTTPLERGMAVLKLIDLSVDIGISREKLLMND